MRGRKVVLDTVGRPENPAGCLQKSERPVSCFLYPCRGGVKMSMTPVHNCNEIDLEKHALIEASAGTGKTYTIENLVIRLLEEREDLGLENILLVTFTEKATSELKIRIREKIEDSLKNPDKDGGKIAQTPGCPGHI